MEILESMWKYLEVFWSTWKYMEVHIIGSLMYKKLTNGLLPQNIQDKKPILLKLMYEKKGVQQNYVRNGIFSARLFILGFIQSTVFVYPQMFICITKQLKIIFCRR
jgi:hypothetical protein